MIPQMLHLVRAGHASRPATLKLAFAAATMAMLAAPGAQAQFDTGGYNSASTPLARAQQSKLEQARAKQEGLRGSDAVSGPLPELQVFAAVSLAETYTTNASGSTGNGKGYDLYTTPGIHLGLLQESSRLTASIDYALTGQYHARFHDLDQLTHRLDATANAELIDRFLFLDAQANAAPTMLSRVGDLSAGDGTPTRGNYRNTYRYAVRPTVMHQFGSFAEVDLWASQSGVYFVRPSSGALSPLPGFFRPPTNSNSTAIGARIASLDDFMRFRWSLNASASNTYQGSHQSQKVRSAVANVSYALSNSFSLIATGGYQTYHSSFLLSKDLDGPTLLGGFQFAPNPNLLLYVQAGTQNNFPTYIGALDWKVTPQTTISASANDKVQTPQQQLMGDLQNGGNLGGALPGQSDPSTPGTPQTGSGFLGDGLSLNNAIYRIRRFDATVSRATERQNYGFSIFATLRDRLDTPVFSFLDRKEKTYGVRAIVSHHLRRDLRASLGVSASKAHEFNGDDRILDGMFSLDYSANEKLNFYFNTDVINRDSHRLIGFSNGNLTDVRVTVGVRKSF